MSEVVVVIGAGSLGRPIAGRVSARKHVVPADLHPENADAAAEVMLDPGFEVSTTTGSDFLTDCGVTASYVYGELAPIKPMRDN